MLMLPNILNGSLPSFTLFSIACILLLIAVCSLGIQGTNILLVRCLRPVILGDAISSAKHPHDLYSSLLPKMIWSIKICQLSMILELMQRFFYQSLPQNQILEPLSGKVLSRLHDYRGVGLVVMQINHSVVRLVSQLLYFSDYGDIYLRAHQESSLCLQRSDDLVHYIFGIGAHALLFKEGYSARYEHRLGLPRYRDVDFRPSQFLSSYQRVGSNESREGA